MITRIKNEIINGNCITKEQALSLISEPIKELTNAANEIRNHFCGNGFDLCSIINAKSGKCSENCRYCAQSAHYNAQCEVYPLIDKETAAKQAKQNEKNGILRFSLVTSGRTLSDEEVNKVCEIIKFTKSKTNISICGSFGILNKKQFTRLKNAGLTRVHNNIESSRSFFNNVCTTHSFDDKLASIAAAKSAGLAVCSGGIMGLGESMEDRIDMAFELNKLGILSIPLNMLNPIEGTPMQNNQVLDYSEMLKIISIFRFINPTASIRLAGGRGLMPDNGKACFKSGANAAITMNMLTTSGITVSDDLKMLNSLGFKPRLEND